MLRCVTPDLNGKLSDMLKLLIHIAIHRERDHSQFIHNLLQCEVLGPTTEETLHWAQAAGSTCFKLCQLCPMRMQLCQCLIPGMFRRWNDPLQAGSDFAWRDPSCLSESPSTSLVMVHTYIGSSSYA